ncbi:MAG TPA: hypothetical protein VLJ42_01070 [Solirubrobacteraceae bacterium]|nr:hypothetical protein [Solirubrobacteraceae bacterium]
MADAGLPEGYLDQYKIAVEMADRVSARRATANSFFVTVQSALVTAFGFAKRHQWPLAVAGIVVAAAWWLSLRSYRMLNGAKFEVINKMEERLPAAPYREEWAILDRKDGPLHKRYAALSFVEQTVPIAFIVLNGLLLEIAL